MTNPLLRNSGVSPPSTQTQPNTSSNQQRVPSIYAQMSQPSTPSIDHGNRFPNSSTMQQLVPQHTNGSAHSNYSVHSVHDFSSEPQNALQPTLSTQSVAGSIQNQQDFYGAQHGQHHEVMYSTVSQLGLGHNLEDGLSRSLSGLDLQGKRNLWG